MSKKIGNKKPIQSFSRLHWALSFLLFILIYIAWDYYGQHVHYYHENPGIHGDSYGGLNTLFSGWAFAGVIIAIIMQRHELKLQREANRLTRKELEGQKRQLCRHNEYVDRQILEAYYAQLLAVMNKRIDEFLYRPLSQTNTHMSPSVIGRRAITDFVSDWRLITDKKYGKVASNLSIAERNKQFSAAYNTIWSIDASCEIQRLGMTYYMVAEFLHRHEEEQMNEEFDYSRYWKTFFSLIDEGGKAILLAECMRVQSSVLDRVDGYLWESLEDLVKTSPSPGRYIFSIDYAMEILNQS